MFHFHFLDCKTVRKALQDKANIIFVCKEKEEEITVRKQLLLEVDEKLLQRRKAPTRKMICLANMIRETHWVHYVEC